MTISGKTISSSFSDWQLSGCLYYVHYARLQKLQIRVLRPWCAYERMGQQKPIRFIRFLASVLSDMTAVLTQRSEQAYREKFHTPARKLRVIPSGFPIGSWRQRLATTKFEAHYVGWKARPRKVSISCSRLPKECCRRAPIGLGRVRRWPYRWKNARGMPGRGACPGMGDQLRFCGSVPNLIERYQDYGIFALTSLREGCPWCFLKQRPSRFPL